MNPPSHPARRRPASPVAGALVAALALVAGRAARADVPPDSVTVSPPPVGSPVAAAADSAPPAPEPGARMTVTSKRVRLSGRGQNVVRSGPGNGFALVGVYPKGLTFPVIAKSGPWYGIRLSDTETGWVHQSLVTELDDLSGLQFRPNPKLYTRTGTYVLGGYGGAYAFDRKSNSLVLGGRLGYYVFDRLETEAGVAWTHVHRPAEIVESLFGLSLEAEDFSMLFYHLSAQWELLPGRQMVPYVGVGVGSTVMLGRSEPSFDFGAGTKLFLSKHTAMRWEVRDYRFHSGADAARLVDHNIEFTLGSEVLF